MIIIMQRLFNCNFDPHGHHRFDEMLIHLAVWTLRHINTLLLCCESYWKVRNSSIQTVVKWAECNVMQYITLSHQRTVIVQRTSLHTGGKKMITFVCATIQKELMRAGKKDVCMCVHACASGGKNQEVDKEKTSGNTAAPTSFHQCSI